VSGPVRLAAHAAEYPAPVRARLGPAAPATLSVLGDPALLHAPLTALFCSTRVPAELVLPALDLARDLRDEGTPVVGGFHSPVERECLSLLLRGRQPLVICLPRSLDRIRLPRAWVDPLADGRLLLVSGCGASVRRPTARLAEERNRLAAALARRVLLIHAVPGGRLYRLAVELSRWAVPLHCPGHSANGDLLLLGATPMPRAR
jgi:predicted Rossmann fold nucleotide-binding protein DprA/Smf involved in DNA uptake